MTVYTLNTTIIAVVEKCRKPDDECVKRNKPLGQFYVQLLHGTTLSDARKEVVATGYGMDGNLRDRY